MISRLALPELSRRLQSFAGVVLLGPRQIGKTTLARQLAETWPGGSVYVDLERPADRRRMDDADAFLRAQAPLLVVIDEVHRLPSLFTTLRGIIDDNRAAGFRTGQFLLLGSASLDLVRDADESLAGRVSHFELSGIAPDEAAQAGIAMRQLWLRGGFPDALTAATDEISRRWRDDLVTSYLERDVPMFAPRVPAEMLRRLWTMIAYSSGGLMNVSRLAANLGVSSQTIARYIDLLVDLGLLRRLEPWFANITARLVKAPKVYVRDTGLLHSLLEIGTMNELLGHPVVGGSFESLAIESLISAAPESLHPHFFRTSTGDEIDLLFDKANRPEMALEIKLSSDAAAQAGFYRSCDRLDVGQRFLVHADDGGAAYESHGVVVTGLTDMVTRLRASSGDR